MALANPPHISLQSFGPSDIARRVEESDGPTWLSGVLIRWRGVNEPTIGSGASIDETRDFVARSRDMVADWLPDSDHPTFWNSYSRAVRFLVQD